MPSQDAQGAVVPRCGMPSQDAQGAMIPRCGALGVPSHDVQGAVVPRCGALGVPSQDAQGLSTFHSFPPLLFILSLTSDSFYFFSILFS